DRVVVENTGRPQAYAQMLAALAGAGAEPEAPPVALAMAERPLTTRIRRILNMEDRSMKMTLPEGLGLLAAAIAGAAISLAAHAEPPAAVSDGLARRTLELIVERVFALPDRSDVDDEAGREAYVDKCAAVINIARAQLKLGDRAAALATIR